jgi:hypothetical protein
VGLLADTLSGGTVASEASESTFPAILWLVPADTSSGGIDIVVCEYRSQTN